MTTLAEEKQKLQAELAKLQAELAKLEGQTDKLKNAILDLKQKIWTIDEQIQSECPHEHTYPIDFFVKCHKCSACGIFLIKRS
jgi:cell division protein FtsB